MGARMVVALGGNALGKTPQEQLRLVQHTASALADLVEEGYDLIVSHGNGPQVGVLNLGLEFAASEGVSPHMPLPECDAMTQGYIGYPLQQSLQNELLKRRMSRDCISLVTQVVVDPEDPAFQNPEKPIGSFYTKAQAERIAQEKGYVFKEDAGRGYRRVVASPEPMKIVEIDTIRKLMEGGVIVIASGGGGIPVTETETGLEGIPAVIDKDRVSSLMARELNAQRLLILTCVDQVSLHFGTPEQIPISRMSLQEARRYMAEGEFAPGSMLPKVEACVKYVEEGPAGAKALIASLDQAREASREEAGTVIYSNC